MREYELNLPNSNRGLDVGRVYFVILEMSRKTYFLFHCLKKALEKIAACNIFFLISCIRFENKLTTLLNDKDFGHAAVTYVDSSAVQALKDLHQEYKARHIQVLLMGTLNCCTEEPVKNVCRSSFKPERLFCLLVADCHSEPEPAGAPAPVKIRHN